jgi:hypothetical protein
MQDELSAEQIERAFLRANPRVSQAMDAYRADPGLATAMEVFFASVQATDDCRKDLDFDPKRDREILQLNGELAAMILAVYGEADKAQESA